MTIKIEESAHCVNRTFRNKEYFASLQVSEITYSPNTNDTQKPYSVFITAIISLYHIDQKVGSLQRTREMVRPPQFVSMDGVGVPMIRNGYGRLTYLHSRISDLYVPEVCELISDPEASAMVIDHLTHRLAEAESKARANVLWSSILEK